MNRIEYIEHLKTGLAATRGRNTLLREHLEKVEKMTDAEYTAYRAGEKEDVAAAAKYLDQLEARWADERQYEDFNEYIGAMRMHLPEGATFISMRKRPFSVAFDLNGKRIELRVSKRGISHEEFIL
jgi:hypothetical protein